MAIDVRASDGRPVPRERPASAGPDRLPGHPSGVRLEVDGTLFDLLHFPDAGERLVVHAHIGRDSAEVDAERMHAALVVNQELARAHAGMYAIGSEGRLVFVTADSLRSATAPTLIADTGPDMASRPKPETVLRCVDLLTSLQPVAKNTAAGKAFSDLRKDMTAFVRLYDEPTAFQMRFAESP